jgi:teichuronic acid biosynthesis glycosyltransferase TuaG
MNAIQSIKEQTYPNVEIIVVNDCSTQKEYYEFSWEGVRMLHLEKNSKDIFGYACPGYVRNQGIKIADGKYIAYCDDDDIWFPKKLELQIDAMKKTGCKMSSTDGFLGYGPFDSTKKYKKYNSEHYFQKIKDIYKNKGVQFLNNEFPYIWNLDFVKIHNSVIASSVVIERGVLDKINYMNHLKIGKEDYNCWLRVLQHTNSVYIKEPCFYYDNKHGEGTRFYMSPSAFSRMLESL